MDTVKIGAFIKAQRNSLNMTQKELAEKIGCTDKAISRWETGKGLPDSSFLIPLANIFNITVNELLTGEKISEEVFLQKTDDNLVNAVKGIEKTAKKGKIIKCALIIALLFCVLSISLLVKNAVNSQNIDTFEGVFNTDNRIDVMEMLLDLNEQTHFFTKDTVCTDYEIELDRAGDMVKADIKMNDEFTHEYINVMLFSSAEQPDRISYRIVRQREFVSTEDGILFTDLCDFLIKSDIEEKCKIYSDIEDYDTINVSGMSTLYFNFDGQSNVSFARQHLFDGELKKVHTAEGMNGKYYETVISTYSKSRNESVTDFGLDNVTAFSGTAFSVYIER